jgi:hypothetical protein
MRTRIRNGTILMRSLIIESGEEKEEYELDGESKTNQLSVELEECLGASEKCSEDILEKLAKVTNDGLRSKLNGEKIKDRYMRPKNMQNLKTRSVNNEIWRHLDRNVKQTRI